MKKDITSLFCFIDDFVLGIDHEIQSHLLTSPESEGMPSKPTRTPGLSTSEIITIMLMFHSSPCKNFKSFYAYFLIHLYRSEFPQMPSYERFITLMPRVLNYLILLLSCIFSPGTSISYIDSTTLKVCHIKREKSHKVFKGMAQKSKSSMGWFFGFKLHVIANTKVELVKVKLTPGNVDDRTVVPYMTTKLTGLLFGDRGYLSQDLFEKLYDRGLKLVTGIKKNMKNKLMDFQEKILLRKRSLSETIFDFLKNKFNIEHSRHRSPLNAFVHIFSTLITYQLKTSKPSLTFPKQLPNP